MRTDKLHVTPYGGTMKNITHVLTNPQDLTEERKRQARENIDAAWGAVVPADADETNLLVSTTTMNRVVDEKIANFGRFVVVPLTDKPPYVPDLSGVTPAVQLSTKIIYLTKDESAGKTDPYTEWIYTGDPEQLVDPAKWEIIGEASPDMESKEDKANKVSEWSATPTDEHYPSEKLVKDELDQKADKAYVDTELDKKLDVNGQFVKNAEKSSDGKTLTLTRSDDTQVEFSGVPGVEQEDNGKFLMAGSEGYSWESVPDPNTKADKVSGAVAGNLAGLDENGNLTDAGIAPDQLEQIPDEYTPGHLAAFDENGRLEDSNVSAQDVATKLHTHDNKTGLDRIPNDLPEASQQLNNEFMLYTDVSQEEPTVSWMRWDTITVEDPQLYIAGRRYKTATIGNQTWMVENLALTIGANNRWYNDDPDTCERDKFGKLYTWDDFMTLNVVGWHLPTKADFNELFGYLASHPDIGVIADDHDDGLSFKAVMSGAWKDDASWANSTAASQYIGKDYYATYWLADEPSSEDLPWIVQLSSDGSYEFTYKHHIYYNASIRLVKDR